MLGGKVRLMPCGAAPFDYKVLQFFRAALGAAVLEVKSMAMITKYFIVIEYISKFYLCPFLLKSDFKRPCISGLWSDGVLRVLLYFYCG